MQVILASEGPAPGGLFARFRLVIALWRISWGEGGAKTTPAERQIVRAQAAEQKRKEAQIAFNRHGLTHEVDPEDARDVGMGTGTPGESEWLYPPTVTTDWMKMIQWAVYSDKSVALGEAKRGGTAARAAEAAAKKEEKADG